MGALLDESWPIETTFRSVFCVRQDSLVCSFVHFFFHPGAIGKSESTLADSLRQ